MCGCEMGAKDKVTVLPLPNIPRRVSLVISIEIFRSVKVTCAISYIGIIYGTEASAKHSISLKPRR